MEGLAFNFIDISCCSFVAISMKITVRKSFLDVNIQMTVLVLVHDIFHAVKSLDVVVLSGSQFTIHQDRLCKI
eukprot:snap_masked-scaffold_3-processed-gene-3.56-mRNA-1 protein AED:1.00 eAED:1.00 QI:0/0/0/0/1/1/3/0/72